MVRGLCAAAAAVALGIGASAQAFTVGTATGDVVVHYNSSAENPGNISYLSTGTNVFNFDPNLVGAPGYGSSHPFQSIANQFQFNLVLNSPTNTGAAPAPVSAINGNSHGTVGTVGADWAISDPNFPSIGNSIFRGPNAGGSSIVWNEVVTKTATGFELNIDGSLLTDGLIHWATSAGGNSNGTTNLSAATWFPNDGHLYFHGTLDYVTADDTTPGADVYSGTITFDTVPAPLPNAAWAGLGLMGLMAVPQVRRRLLRA